MPEHLYEWQQNEDNAGEWEVAIDGEVEQLTPGRAYVLRDGKWWVLVPHPQRRVRRDGWMLWVGLALWVVAIAGLMFLI